jgi:hypothetical protein
MSAGVGAAFGGFARGGCSNSFAGTTGVLMADGTSKAISLVRVGDTVLATDPTTGKTEERRVTDLITGTGEKHLVEITVDTDAGQSKIVATENHPFWAADLKSWVNAKDLRSGYHFETADHRPATVHATRAWTKHTTVYNLTVDELHTYHVAAGAADILVHNCSSEDLKGYADFLRPNGGKNGVKVAAKYTSPSGRSYFGYNGHDVKAPSGSVMDTLIQTQGKAGHGYCAEMMCLILAEKAEGEAAFGGVMDVVRVRGLSSQGNAHGTPMSPCATACRTRLFELDIDHEMGGT